MGCRNKDGSLDAPKRGALQETLLYVLGGNAQSGASGAQYFLGDALGSVRQLVDAGGEVLRVQSYEPYGEVLVERNRMLSP